MSSVSSVIKFTNVSKQFGSTTVLRDVSFDVRQGEVIGFVGPNGAGKTTTISLLLGFIKPSAGSIRLFDELDVEPSKAHLSHRRIGYCSSDMALFENLTGNQLLDFYAGRYGVEPEIRRRLIHKLQPQLNKKLRLLSRGNKQKIALVAALQHDPELIVLDEPTSGLDPLMQEVFLEIIRTEAERGATVFMSSHILSEVASVCDRILFMKSGKIRADDTIAAIESKAGKVITITSEPRDVEILQKILPEGASVLESSEDKLVIKYDGDLHIVLRWLTAKKFQDISIEDRQLDDIFYDLYHEEQQSI